MTAAMNRSRSSAGRRSRFTGAPADDPAVTSAPPDSSCHSASPLAGSGRSPAAATPKHIRHRSGRHPNESPSECPRHRGTIRRRTERAWRVATRRSASGRGAGGSRRRASADLPPRACGARPGRPDPVRRREPAPRGNEVEELEDPVDDEPAAVDPGVVLLGRWRTPSTTNGVPPGREDRMSDLTGFIGCDVHCRGAPARARSTGRGWRHDPAARERHQRSSNRTTDASNAGTPGERRDGAPVEREVRRLVEDEVSRTRRARAA